jgi:hypothetical protein
MRQTQESGVHCVCKEHLTGCVQRHSLNAGRCMKQRLLSLEHWHRMKQRNQHRSISLHRPDRARHECSPSVTFGPVVLAVPDGGLPHWKKGDRKDCHRAFNVPHATLWKNGRIDTTAFPWLLLLCQDRSLFGASGA